MSMRKIHILWIVIGIFLYSGFLLSAEYVVELKTRFYAGTREGEVDATESVTSSYLQPMVTATVPARFLLAEEKAQIGRVFNLKDVNLIAEADYQSAPKNGALPISSGSTERPTGWKFPSRRKSKWLRKDLRI